MIIKTASLPRATLPFTTTSPARFAGCAAHPNHRAAGPAVSPWEYLYTQSHSRPPATLLDEALTHCREQLRAPGRAIDLGAGAGRESRLLFERTAWEILAVDADPRAAHHFVEGFNRTLPARVQFETGCLMQYPLPPNEADMVWAGSTLPYLPPEEIIPLVARIIDTLKPGGVFAADFFGPLHGRGTRMGASLVAPHILEEAFHGLETLKCQRTLHTPSIGCGNAPEVDLIEVIVRKPSSTCRTTPHRSQT